MKKVFIKSIYNILGSICIGNGLWMLISASSWFYKMPISIEDTGPINMHFIHDVGLAFILTGFGSIWCGYKLKNCIEIHFGITIFIVGHALIHIIEILTNSLPQSHWIIDFPLITFPAVLLLLVTPFVIEINKDV